MRRWIPAFLVATSYAFSWFAYSRLPLEVDLRWDALIPWVGPGDTEALPRAAAAFGVPTMALAVWTLMRGLASSSAERLGRRLLPPWLLSPRTGARAVERFGPSYDAIVAVVVAIPLLIHGATLGAALGSPGFAPRVFTSLLGVAVMVLGNIMPRTRPNWIAGLRTRRIVSDPDLWRRTHRYFGALLMLTGIAVIAASWLAGPYALIVALGGFLASALAASILGRMKSGSRGAEASFVALTLGALSLAGPVGLAGQAVPTSPYADVVEHPFDVTSSGLVLPGTLALPATFEERIPVAVLVAGSGPTDRDGNGPLVQTDLYAQLAHELARRGIASVRYDKRGIGEAARTLDHTALTLDDFVGDVTEVARVVAGDARFSSVYLIGHSEGAGLVLQAANRGAPAAGLAMLSGIGRPLSEVLHEQFAAITDSVTLTRIDSAFARFLRGEDVADAPEIAKPVLVPGYRRLISSMAAYDPVEEIARVRVPVLVVQGGMDLQVTDGDAERLRAAQPAASWLPIPSANHVFKAAASRDPTAQLPLYQDRSIPIVPGLAEGIADWVHSARTSRSTTGTATEG